MENRKRIAVLMGPPALFLLFLFVLPLAVMAIFTFRAGAFGAEREVFTLAHYREFLANPAYTRMLWRSTWIAFLVSALSVTLAYPWPTSWPFGSAAAR
jgi:ABC-type spermidine/putrescine transport system permease subunit I